MELIDLALFDQPGGREKLATRLYSALKNIAEQMPPLLEAGRRIVFD